MSGLESYSDKVPEKKERILKFMSKFKDDTEFYNYVFENRFYIS